MGKKDEKEITADEILTYIKLRKYTLLATSAVIHTEYPKLGPVIIHTIQKGAYHYSLSSH